MERRKFKRIDVNIITNDLYPISGAEIFRKKGQITNLSAGGLAVETKDTFKLKDNVYLTFTLPNKIHIKEVYAHIIRLDKRENINIMGLRFVNIDENSREAIKQYTSTIDYSKETQVSTNPVIAAADGNIVRRVNKKKKEKGIYKTAFRKPKRNKEFLEAVHAGVAVKELIQRFGLSESGISMLKKRLMKRDSMFKKVEKRFNKINLKKFRKLKIFTQDELAKKIGVRRETITRWEKKLFEPSALYKWKLMKLLSIRKVKDSK